MRVDWRYGLILVPVAAASAGIGTMLADPGEPVTPAIAPAVILVESTTVLRYDDEVVQVNRVVDGDTVDLTINPGYQLTVRERCRLLGVDAPERGEPGYESATVMVSSWTRERDLRVAWSRTDSFGRILCDLYDPAGSHLSNVLIGAGYG
jgi:endonuclease YncB( thermonuclease family)